MKKDQLLNQFSKNALTPQSQKESSLDALKKSKSLHFIDSGMLVAIKGGDTNNPPPTIVKTN